MSMISICVENDLYTSICYPIFLLKNICILFLPFFILVNRFQCNLTSSWPCLFKSLAWHFGILHNWRQSIELETSKSSRSRWNIRSRQLRCWRGIKFIPKPRLKWTYPSTTWYLCYLWGQPSRSMCSRWNKHSKWAIEKVTKFYMSFPQTSKGKRHLLQITSMSGTITGRLWMHHLRRG